MEERIIPRNGRLYVDETTDGRGRGVFTTESIEDGELIEVCPMIVLEEQDTEKFDDTILFNYYFLWGNEEKQSALCLGFGSMYNHSYNPNAEYLMDFENNYIFVMACKSIAAGEEICFNYNGKPDDQTKVWFDKS